MIVFRICNSHYANDLSGIGAKLYGGRWNNKGHAVLYTSSTRALATLEVLVHLPTINVKPIDFSIVSINIPNNSLEEISYHKIKAELLENGFDSNLKKIGDKWLNNNSSLVLKVPSIVIHEEFNYLINPLHKDFSKIKIVDKKTFSFDSRLLV